MKSTVITSLYPLYIPEPIIPRSEGLHVSNIIRCLAMESGILRPEWCDELSLSDVRTITDPIAILRINIGLAWEEHYIPMLRNVVDHPEELKLDGVYMSRDGESVSVIITPKGPQVRHTVHEVKATYKSTNTVGDLSSEKIWMMQIMAYLKASATRYAHFHVLFLCGDYSRPITPRMEVWELEFEQEELDDNWQLLTGYRDYRLKREKEE